MADRQPQQIQAHPQRGMKGLFGDGPPAAKIVAVLTLLPIGATLLGLAGCTLTGSLIALALATPVFIIFSPVLVPAAFIVGVAVVSFLASGLFGLTGLSSVSCFFDSARQVSAALPSQLSLATRRVQDVTGQIGQKGRELGQSAQSKIHETAKQAS